MRFFKSRMLWLAVYAVFITGVFLYVLFPSARVLKQVEARALSAGLTLKAASLDPAMPLGIKLKDFTVSRTGAARDPVFQGELLDLQLDPVSLFQKIKRLSFQGRAYNGSFDGSAGWRLSERTQPPAEGTIAFQNIDLGRLNGSGFPMLRGVTGKARGTSFYVREDPTGRGPVGKLSLYLSRGAYPLPEPFLGVSRIEFDRGEISAQLKNGTVTLEKLEIYGTQINCFLSGSIIPANRPEDSLLNLKGMMEIVGKNKIKMNVTVSGTLARPTFRYI